MTQNPLHSFRVLLPLIHKPIREGMAEVVESESISVRDHDTSQLRSGPQMISDKCGRRAEEEPSDHAPILIELAAAVSDRLS